MEQLRGLSICGVILGSFWLSHTVPQTFAFDKPLLSSSFALYSAAFAVLALGLLVQRRGDVRRSGDGQYEGLPLGELHHGRNESTFRIADVPAFPVHLLRGRFSVRDVQLPHILIGAIVIRLEIFHQILANTQCAVLTLEPLVPVLLAIWDYGQRRLKYRSPQLVPARENDFPNTGQSGVLSATALGIFGVASLVALATTRDPPSTFICAATLHSRWFIPLMQRFGTFLDFVIIQCIRHLYAFEPSPGSLRTKDIGAQLSSLGSTVMRAAQINTLWSSLLFTIYLIAAAKSQERLRMFEVPAYYLWSLVNLVASMCFTLVCALLASVHVGSLNVCLLSAFVSVCTVTTSTTLSQTHAYPVTNATVSLIAISATTLAFAAYLHLCLFDHQLVDSDSERRSSRPSLSKKFALKWPYVALLLFVCGRCVIWTLQSGNAVDSHPIDNFIHNARLEHNFYRRQALESTSLDAAAATYLRRYHKHPPPAFGHWYDFALERNSIVIDEYDSIDRDLHPFFKISPQDLRYYTKLIIQDRWYDATGISIRDGKAAISSDSHVNDDHRWMMERLVDMIGTFSQWLPDMDMAFNINDECRIAVPWHDTQSTFSESARPPTSPSNNFSPHRTAQWSSLSNDLKGKIMSDISWQPIFHSHGTLHCPLGSRAKGRHWDRSRHCSMCASEHSFGPFPNWTQMSDICHQPDLAELHGFYTSPSAFKSTGSRLLPLFSQSKAPGFHDILYPSAWNWASKATYRPSEEFPDVPFANKNESIFWRGSTSEGMSPDTGQWKGHSRQRFLHALNNINVGGATQTLLLPRDSTTAWASQDESGQLKGRLQYTPVPIETLTSLIATDVHFTGYQRCWDIDCPQEAVEFGLGSNTDFQAHWHYKYLLDLDGAGFSGRFLPFLFSRSLPFKAALFQEWWHDRVTAWHHFVPLDLRANGIWPTLVYFTGISGKINGKQVTVPPHQSEAQTIAENGREWARQVLRKEDMEVYFFRLLLEWGRLTDDNRDSIGFKSSAG